MMINREEIKILRKKNTLKIATIKEKEVALEKSQRRKESVFHSSPVKFMRLIFGVFFFYL
jgi:hypothetical protein